MSKKIILDTNFIVGLLDEKDKRHNKCLLIKRALHNGDNEIYIFDFIINEVINVFVKRLKERKDTHNIIPLIEKLQRFVPLDRITWIYPDIEEYFDKVIERVKQSKGAFNFHDALIIHIANEFEMPYIVSFDEDFDKARLRRINDARDI
ncbi:MAG: type II toxin-antitoxin system VapC family toxin [Nitrospirae bacterium]|nr:type II toxin-antitoxin system VapC family toxin [Nitrospirota bacterium]